MRCPRAVRAQATSMRSCRSPRSTSGDLNLYNLGFDATWEVDLFGGTRRAVQAASAESIAVQADLADTRVQLAAEVAQAYVDLRDRERVRISRGGRPSSKRGYSA